ncbi:serine/threonine-protein kinase [Myxococcus sp. RHSTA-1-4]|uniref:serine/threonine-protein kinase n=1 Tax=Myxococcus sp. RHSTA-1-4 TaxID=2874601 RepID=UPI001CBB9B22|nr:serine/threonine-protein kinase [Myxococcus sp. RHSTA-1-4]MBZ4415715.1 serine/threonine protein kinase [Myxococcus sp. RHSTA-1-4]
METGNLNPAVLPPGTRVGPWRVVGLQGRGAYGAVYRATGVEPPASGLVALKLALFPRDERFGREAELLSRVRHPAVPRLLDAGDWLAPSGTPHPYLAMELIEGVPLYEWARRQPPSSRQVLQLLASLARALAATHAAGGVHRDFKGGNVLVRSSDAQPFLIDFGAGHFLGASTLTWQLFPPGTPAYRAPEAWRYVLRANPDSAPPYPAGPADDVFALGVTSYRLLTEQYPPSTDPELEESRPWYHEGSGARPARDLNDRCCPELSALISRMLSVKPEARGSARELAEALEAAARAAGPEADVPLFAWAAPRAVRLRASPPRRVAPRATGQGWRPWLMAVSVGGTLAFGAGGALGVWLGEESPVEPLALRVEAKDGGAVAVGDSALTAPAAPTQAPSAWSSPAVELPPKPLPGQRRPDASGRCPGELHVPIHGGCWIKLNVALKDCDKEDGYVYQGGCYTPALPRARPPMSSPMGPPDHR